MNDKDLKCLTAQQVSDAVGISKRQLWRMKSQGTFPPPDIQINRVVRWRLSTIEHWMNETASKGGSYV